VTTRHHESIEAIDHETDDHDTPHRGGHGRHRGKFLYVFDVRILRVLRGEAFGCGGVFAWT
jgi:hypothetical protein